MADEGPSKKICIRSRQMSPPRLDDRLKTVNELLFPYVTHLALATDSTGWLPTTVWFCGLLSGKDPPTERILQKGLVPLLILFLTKKDFPDLQVEAAKALTYLGSGTSRVKAKNRATLIHLLDSKDESVLEHACCSLAVLSGCDNAEVVDFIRDSDLHHRLRKLIEHPTLAFAALRTLGNIMEGDARLIDWCANHRDLLERLKICLADECVEVRREACWMISYITAERDRIQLVCELGLIEVLVKLVLKDEFVVMEAAVHAISNAACGATAEQIGFMVSAGCIETLCFLFCCRNSAIFKACLEGLEHILKAGCGDGYVNPYAVRISRINGWQFLERAVPIYGRVLFEKGLDLLFEYGEMPVYAWKERVTFREDGYESYDE